MEWVWNPNYRQNQQFFKKILSQRAYEEWECRFLRSQLSTMSAFSRKIYAWHSLIPIPLRLYRFSHLRFNMASPIAFRLGLKNAGRLASFLSLTPKVCLKHAVVMTFQIFKYFMDKSRLLFAERSQKVALYVLQGKTGILACKRYGSTALSYEQVRDDTVDKMLCLRVYFIKYVFTTHLALFLNYITSTYIICWWDSSIMMKFWGKYKTWTPGPCTGSIKIWNWSMDPLFLLPLKILSCSNLVINCNIYPTWKLNIIRGTTDTVIFVEPGSNYF